MIQRKTQNAEYWQKFALIPADVEFLHNLLLDAEQPKTTEALALALITERCRREEAELRAELGRGTIYQPKKRFQVGDKLLFPALDFRLGEVRDIRPGQNPEYGEFDVLTVDFGPDRRQRSFATGLTAPHKLNVNESEILISGDVQSPETLLATIAANVPTLLQAQLMQQTAFATFENRWLLRDLLAEIHVGHLNLAEAVIEDRAAPVTSAALLAQLDLPAEIKPDVLAFSLNSALAADGRFDQVGPGESRRWFLTRLEPAEALAMPEPLRFTRPPYDRDRHPERPDPGRVGIRRRVVG